MPISKSIPQPSGVVATYHKATGGGFGANSLTTTILSFLDAEHTDAQGFAPLSETPVDCSAVLPSPATNPPIGATIAQVVFGIVEDFAIQNPACPFNGGTLVS